MSDSESDSKPKTPSVPSWQRAEPEETKTKTKTEAKSSATSSTTSTDAPKKPETKDEPKENKEEKKPESTKTNTPEKDRLAIARKFLEDNQVRNAPRDKKVEFLKSKDISDDDIQTLLGDEDEPKTAITDKPREDTLTHPPSQSTPSSSRTPPTDRAPVVTYPEFMAKPARPPPLVTTNGLLNTLYAIVGLSTLVYGTSKSVVQPMVQAQTDARTEYLDTTKRNIDALVSKLEKTVSVLPPSAAAKTTIEEESDAEDPTEMFHRDMGTQTVDFPLWSSRDKDKKEGEKDAAMKRQVDVLTKLNKSLSNLKDGSRSQSEEMANLAGKFDEFNSYLDGLTYSANTMSSLDVYGRSRKIEPKDGIRTAKEQIRLIKGLMLSTRNFSTSVR